MNENIVNEWIYILHSKLYYYNKLENSKTITVPVYCGTIHFHLRSCWQQMKSNNLRMNFMIIFFKKQIPPHINIGIGNLYILFYYICVVSFLSFLFLMGHFKLHKHHITFIRSEDRSRRQLWLHGWSLLVLHTIL